MYDSAQEDWALQGNAGSPMFGIGSPEYFNSIFNVYPSPELMRV